MRVLVLAKQKEEGCPRTGSGAVRIGCAQSDAFSAPDQATCALLASDARPRLTDNRTPQQFSVAILSIGR